MDFVFRATPSTEHRQQHAGRAGGVEGERRRRRREDRGAGVGGPGGSGSAAGGEGHRRVADDGADAAGAGDGAREQLVGAAGRRLQHPGRRVPLRATR